MQKGRFGYRLPVGRHGSLPLQFADSPRRFSLVLLDDFLPANAREENPTAALFLQLSTFYPDLHIDAVVGDAGFGYDIILNVVYNHLHARRVIALRAHKTDKDKALWPECGYDDKGCPICHFGYAFTVNGLPGRCLAQSNYSRPPGARSNRRWRHLTLDPPIFFARPRGYNSRGPSEPRT